MESLSSARIDNIFQIEQVFEVCPKKKILFLKSESVCMF